MTRRSSAPKTTRPPRTALRLAAALAAAATAATLAACASTPTRQPVTLVPKVDLPRFMGDWYVIANIPTFLEKGAHNAKDSYTLAPDGTIPTTFSFNADGFDGPRKSYGSKGFVMDGGANAVWGQQYIWPIKADYRISYLSADYTQTVITRDKRDYVWILARTPQIPEADLARLIAFVGTQGYDTSKIERVPQAPAR
jgi:apolipoprotein D and lipocalin family protein